MTQNIHPCGPRGRVFDRTIWLGRDEGPAIYQTAHCRGVYFLRPPWWKIDTSDLPPLVSMPVSGRVYGVSVRADAFELTEDNEILVSSVPSQIGGGEGEGFLGYQGI